MNANASPERLQGQLIALNVLLETILRTLSAQTMKEIKQSYQTIAPEVAGQLLNTQANDATLEAYSANVESTMELLTQIHQQAIFRDSAAGRL